MFSYNGEMVLTAEHKIQGAWSDLDSTPPTLNSPKPTHLHPLDVDPTTPPGSFVRQWGDSDNAWRVWRTPDRRSETIPSSRITPDPLDSQLHDGASSLQFTSLIAEAWLYAQWLIFVLFLRFVFGLLYGWKIQTWPIIRFLTESVTYWFFYLLVFDRIHDAMCLNKMSRTSSRNIDPQHQKYSSIFHCTHGVLFIPVFTKPILSVCC